MSETTPEVGEVWTTQTNQTDWEYRGEGDWRLTRSEIFPQNVGCVTKHGPRPYNWRRISPRPPEVREGPTVYEAVPSGSGVRWGSCGHPRYTLLSLEPSGWAELRCNTCSRNAQTGNINSGRFRLVTPALPSPPAEAGGVETFAKCTHGYEVGCCGTRGCKHGFPHFATPAAPQPPKSERVWLDDKERVADRVFGVVVCEDLEKDMVGKNKRWAENAGWRRERALASLTGNLLTERVPAGWWK